MSTEATPGDVIQIDPEHDEAFGGCLAVVEEVKSWGVSLCGVQIPAKGIAYYRVPHGKYAVIGRAEWVQAEGAQPNE